jgi:tripartite-type tricarboxylate transporter receptor subunit TctC
METKRLRGVLAALLSCACVCAQGQNFPVKPIRIVVPFTPGGPNDILARIAGQRLTTAWGQQVIVDNRPGGGTVIGSEFVAKAPPDGYTMLMVSTSHAANVSLMSKLPFDTLRDFAAVIQAVSSPNVLVVHPSVPARSTRELVAIAKAKPGQINFASGGSGSATHLSGELLRLTAGVNMTHIPYKGAAPATIDLISGQVSWMFGTILPTLPHVKAGKLRAIGVSSRQRVAVLPEIPPIGDDLPGFEAVSWYGMFVPAATPADLIAKLNQEIARGFTLPEVRERLAKEGTEVVAGSPADFAALFKSEVAKWARVIREAKIKLE